MENVIRLKTMMMQKSVLKKDMLVYYVALEEQLLLIYPMFQVLKSNRKFHHVIIAQMDPG
jgi:hypothetical protein